MIGTQSNKKISLKYVCMFPCKGYIAIFEKLSLFDKLIIKNDPIWNNLIKSKIEIIKISELMSICEGSNSELKKKNLYSIEL